VRSDEYAISDGQATIESREILDLAIIADRNVDVKVSVLADVAASADSSTLTDLGPMPDRGIVPDSSLGGDLRSLMNAGGHDREP
jgi:hypothetical protein